MNNSTVEMGLDSDYIQQLMKQIGYVYISDWEDAESSRREPANSLFAILIHDSPSTVPAQSQL